MIFTTGNLLTLGVVLVALILYRQLDRNNRSLDKVRKYGERLKDDLASFVAERETAVKDYAVELDVQQKSAKELLRRIITTEEGLNARTEAIAKIDERISAYDKSLEELLRMTSRAQENLVRIRDESAFTDSVIKKVKEAKDQFEGLEKGLSELELRFERENADALEQAVEASTAAVVSTVSDLQATAETIERRVEDHRDAVALIERERAETLARDISLFSKAYDEALQAARDQAEKLEDAAFVKLKEQALERSRKFQILVEDKLAQYQEASKARLTEVQGLVKNFKEEWKTDALELEVKQKAYKDEWKKDVSELDEKKRRLRDEWKQEAQELAAVAKAGRDEWSQAVIEVRAAVEAAEAAIASEGAVLISQAAAAAKSSSEAIAAETTAAATDIRSHLGEVEAGLKAQFSSFTEDLQGALAQAREESVRTERDANARSAAVEALLVRVEGDFRRRAAALEEGATRIESEALSSAAEDAGRRQSEILAAVETSIAALSDRLGAESEKVDADARALEKKRSDFTAQFTAFIDEINAKLNVAAETAEGKVLSEIEGRLEAYRDAQTKRFEALENLADDVARLDAELRHSMAETENRVREDFSLFEKEAESERKSVSAIFDTSVLELKEDMDGVEKELAALKTRAYDNVSEKLKLFEDDFFTDLSKRSDEIDKRLSDWKESLDDSLEKLGAEAAEKRENLEAVYAEDLRVRLSEQSERTLSDLERLKEQAGVFEEGVRDQLGQADQSLSSFKEQLVLDLEEARNAASASAKAELGRHALEMAELLKKDQRELNAELKALIESVEERRQETATLLDNSRRDMEAWQAKVVLNIREADTAVDEARKRARELAAESDERLVSTRNAIQEVREEADAHRIDLFSHTDEQARNLDIAIKDADKRIKEFIAQTKLFEKADELKDELEHRIEDLSADLDRLDQRRSEATELEAQFVKIKRLEDEVNAKMTRFLSEKRRVELMEADFKRLIQTAQSVDEKLAQVSASDDALQALQAQMRKLEDAASEAEEKYQRVERKNQILDATSDGIDRNFQALREADATAKRLNEDLAKVYEELASVRSSVEKLSLEKDRADQATEKLTTLDSSLAQIEDRIEIMQKAREWLARTETRLEEASKQAQEQVKLMGTLLKEEGRKGSSKERGAPPIGTRETVVKLAHQGWSVDEISRAVKLSKGEVELILEISPKA